MAGIPFLNWPEIKCMHFFYFYARILMAAKSFKEGGARLAETILQRGAARHLCISVCQSRKIHRLVTRS